MSTPRLLSTREVARRLSVDTRTVHRMVKSGRLTPALKVPGYRGALLFDPDVVPELEETDES